MVAVAFLAGALAVSRSALRILSRRRRTNGKRESFMVNCFLVAVVFLFCELLVRSLFGPNELDKNNGWLESVIQEALFE